MADGYQRDEAPTERVSRREGRRWMDEQMLRGLSSAHDSLWQLEGNRLAWWRTRRRLRRKYGVVAIRMSGTKWRVRRDLPDA